MENTLTRKKQIITAKALTTVIGITLSVAIPQLFHVIGIVSGTGSFCRCISAYSSQLFWQVPRWVP